MEKKSDSKQAKITKIEVTTDKITGRGGLFLFMKYVENIGFFMLFEKHFAFIKGSCKGLSCLGFIKQLVAWFVDGTEASMQSFDRRKRDESFMPHCWKTGRMRWRHRIKLRECFASSFLSGRWFFVLFCLRCLCGVFMLNSLK